MSFIKSFQEFKAHNVDQVSEKAISGGAVKKETPKSGELARYTVTLKASADTDTISDENPAQSALDFLVNSQDFKTWYSGTSTLKDAAESDFDIKNSQSVAFIETGKHRQAGFLRREKATETFIFKPIGRVAYNTENESDLNYDLLKFPPQAKTQTSDGLTVYAWNIEREPEMTFETKPRVKIPWSKLTTDEVLKTKPTVSTSEPSRVEPGQTTPAGPQPAGATVSSETAKYAGLKLTQTFDKRIQDLQKLIIAKGGAPAQAIKARGGAVGKYGTGTAKAIGLLIGTNSPVNEITPEVDAKLQAALAGVTVPTATGQVGAADQSKSTISGAQAKATGKASAASETVKQAAEKLLSALQGYGEDEEAVYEVFGKGKKEPYIKDYRELNALLSYWNSQRVPWNRGYTDKKTFDQLRKVYPNPDPKRTTLSFWLRNLFSEAELKTLNDLIKSYATFKF